MNDVATNELSRDIESQQGGPEDLILARLRLSGPPGVAHRRDAARRP